MVISEHFKVMDLHRKNNTEHSIYFVQSRQWHRRFNFDIQLLHIGTLIDGRGAELNIYISQREKKKK